ncbi:hypothetical protein BBP40_008033 [Aspergillus hancockii]|nr:hypothetical protein BBP40_008033 [Aspergillus hancockii]
MRSSMLLSASDRLRRSKSSRSIRRSHQASEPGEPFDPVIARQHATVAASLAMRRSAERSSAESQRSYDRLGGPGSMAVPQRRHKPDNDTEASDPLPTVTMSQSQLLTASDMENSKNNQISLAALPPISEFGGLDGRNSSQPSSYRRLRKSRSMFAAGQRYSRSSYGAPPRLYSYATNDKAQELQIPHPGGVLRRSMSFLRGNHQTDNALRHAKSHDAAIQLARSQFLQNSVDDTHQRRDFSFTRSKREHKPFRKTFRRSSATAMDATSTPSSIDSSRNAISHSRARSFSSSIKRGIKRALGLSKPAVEHNEAQGSPLYEKASQIIPPISTKDGIYSTEQDHNAVCSDRLAAFNPPPTVRSTRSSESLTTSCSRVTSWADSTVANTIVTRKTGEQTHLSIIDECGDSRANLSFLTPSNSPRPECPLTSESIRPEHSIDSKRLYAALMRRIGQNTQNTEEIVLGQVREHRAIPTRASSLYPRSSRQTIRRVPSDESITSPGSYATAPGSTMTPQKCPAMFGVQSAPGDDARSAVVAGYQGSVTPDSPSVYSRTTSGESPTGTNCIGELSEDKPKDEPGVATIFESQRSTYSSPKRTAGPSATETQSRPSADWQQWMQSQMARIENLTPTREHYREDAQIYDEAANLPRRSLFLEMQEHHGILASQLESPDHDDLSAKKEPITACKIRAGSNFSRPFSRSPSVCTMVPVSKEYASGTAVPSSTPITISPIMTRSSGGQTFSVGRTRARVDQSTSSPMQSRSINRSWMPESPTPKREAREMSQGLTLSGKHGRYSTKWSPTQDTRAAPFRSSRYCDSTRPTNENLRADDGYSGRKEPYTLSQDTYSPMSSKRMVELFLNSRRQQLATEISDNSAPDGAFL